MTSDSRQYTGPEWDPGSPAAHGPTPEPAPSTHSDPMSPPWASGPPQGHGWTDQPVAGRASVGWDPGAAAGTTPPWTSPEPAPAPAPGNPFPPPPTWTAQPPSGPVPTGGAAGPDWETRQPASPAVTTPSAPVHQPVSAQPEQPHPTVVPLPPQPTRVPGASLAGSPPPGDPPLPHTEHRAVAAPDHHFGGGQPSGPTQAPWAPENPPGHGEQSESRPVARATVPSPRLPHDFASGSQGDHAPFAPAEVASAGHAAVPSAHVSVSVAQDTPPASEPAEAKPSGATVSASASVPTANRIAPPADYSAQPVPAPRSRVYGRPAAEPAPDPAPSGRPTAEPAPGPALYGRPVAEPAADPYDRPAPEPAASPAPYDRPVAEPTPAATPYRQDVPPAGYAPTAQLPFGPPAPVSPGPVSPGPVSAPPDVPPPGVDSGASNPAPPWPGPGEAGGFPGQTEPPSSNPFPPQPEFGAAPPWAQPDVAEQERFNAFQSEPEPTEASDEPPKRERNGRVLLLTILAALLILGIPLGILTLIGKIGGGSAAFDPAVGECVKQSGISAVAVDCSDPDAHTVVSKVDDASKCEDPNQPYVALSGGSGQEKILCLRPANEPTVPAGASPESTTDG